MGDAAGDVKTAKKTAGKLSGALLTIVLKVCKCDCLFYQFFSFFLIRNIKSAEIINIFKDCKLVKNSYILQDNSNLLFYRIIVRTHLFTENPYGSFIIFQKRKHTVDGCGFSGTVRTQKSKHLSFGNIQIQMVKGYQIAISFYQIFYLYNSGCHIVLLPRC